MFKAKKNQFVSAYFSQNPKLYANFDDKYHYFVVKRAKGYEGEQSI